MRKCYWLSSLQMKFANGLLMALTSFLWTEATTESTKHQNVEATSFGETCKEKKATNFEKLTCDGGKKKEHLRPPIVSHFRSKDIYCVEKQYLPQSTKHLKGKKRQKGNIWTRWIRGTLPWSWIVDDVIDDRDRFDWWTIYDWRSINHDRDRQTLMIDDRQNLVTDDRWVKKPTHQIFCWKYFERKCCKF